MKIKRFEATEAHNDFHRDVCDLLDRHAAHLSAQEILAVSARVVGQLVALQDQRQISPAQAMDIVAANIEQGNKEAFTRLAKPMGHG